MTEAPSTEQIAARYRWIRIAESRYTLGLTTGDAHRLAVVAAARARQRVASDPDELHEAREVRELEEKWGNVEHLVGLLVCAQPAHEIDIAEFEVSATPVTFADYAKFIRATGVARPASRGSRSPTTPLTGVSWQEATAYAAWLGAMLPSEAQWERVARGVNRALFPWGNEWGSRGERLDDDDQFVPVGSRAERSTPEGVHDLVAFGYEWCADEFRPYPGASESACDPSPPGGWLGTRVRRGGPIPGFPPTAATRRGVAESVRLRDTTFRLVRKR